MARADVAGMGNPLLDLTVEVEDALLRELGLEKGKMHLIPHEQGERILQRLAGTPMTITPGGSAANTAAGVCTLGGTAAYLGTIGDDEYGSTYERLTEEHGVHSLLKRLPGERTGYAVTFITPDGERTFTTHLGAAEKLRPEHVNEQAITDAKILHIEGFQLEDPKLREAVLHAMKIAKKHGTKVSMDLADAWMITRNKEVFTSIVTEYADIVFVNETEAKAFTGLDPEAAAHKLGESCEVACVKIGEHGSLIRCSLIEEDGNLLRIPGVKSQVINTNGAGDMYAGAILYCIAHGIPLARAGRIASHAAAKVVETASARLNGKLDISIIEEEK